MAITALTAALLGGGAGFGLSKLLGGKKKAKLPPMPSLGPMGKWAQTNLYKDVGRGMEGGGLIPPGIRSAGLGGVLSAYKKARPEAEWDLENYLDRFVPQEDTRVRGFARGMLSRSFHTTMQDLKEQEKLKPFEEQQEAMGMAGELLGQEKRMGTEITNMYNQYGLAQSQMPTYGSNLAYGLGAAGGWASAAQKWSQMMGQD